MPRVTAILVARDAEAEADEAIRAIREQSRAPDELLVVDAGSTDRTAEKLREAKPDVAATAPAVGLGEAAVVGARALPPTASADEWLWLLSDDSRPLPDALAQLLHAVEIAPSVAIAGPKVVRPDDPSLVRSYGVSVSRFGETVPLIDSELDQGQYDREADVLGVSSTGMLVRRAVWDAIGGPDPGLPSVDSGLDLSIRARLAGHRVVRVPGARVARTGGVEDFGRRRRLGRIGRHRVARRAQLHRRMVYAPAASLPLHWLSLLPLAILRSVGHLLGKRPGAVPGEFAAALAIAFADPGIAGSRRRLARARSASWAAIAPLRVAPADLRRRRASARERAAEGRTLEAPLVRAEFFGGGGVWIVVAAGLLGLAAFWRLLGASAITGGGLLPLSATVPELWRHATAASADPFLSVLAVLGSITFWSPSFSVLLLWLIALPLAALGGWWCATRFTERVAGPLLAGALWALAPPFLLALQDGRLGAVVAHLALPWLVLAAIEGRRSWSAAATASLLFAVVAASAPSLVPALLVGWIAWTIANPRALVRLGGMPIPALALFLSLGSAQIARGTPLALFADPGVALPFAIPSGAGLAILEPVAGSSGWAELAQAYGRDPVIGSVVAAALLAPLAVLALAALFLPGSRRAIPPLALALAGLGTAVAAVHLVLASTGADPVAVWPGSALSLYWLALALAAAAATRAIGRAAPIAVLLVSLCACGLVAPLVVASATGASAVAASDGRTLPALVAASAARQPRLQTLVLVPQDDGSLRATLEAGTGTTLDETSTLAATHSALTTDQRALARLAGNLASRSGLDPASGLKRFAVGFVLLDADRGSDSDAAATVRDRVSSALDGTAALTQVARTSERGTLWEYGAARQGPAPASTASPGHAVVLAIEAFVVAVALLLAIPTRRRRQVISEREDELRSDTFAEDVDD